MKVSDKGAEVHSFDQREPVNKAFAGSLLTHAGVIALLTLSGVWNLTKNNFGSPRVSSGSVGVGIVKSIPIPRKEGPNNPLANDTTSVVPQLPEPVRPQMKVKLPPPDAIPIPKKSEKPKKLSPQEQSKTLFRPPEEYKSNQVYSRTPQATNSPMYGTQGSGGIDIGPASVLGSRFGAYVDLMRDRISQHWNTAGVNSSPSQKCAVTFTIARNGMVSNVQISQASGNYLLDTSARRAILDANPLPALPPQFDRNDATVELWFQLRQ
jgi:periplasmic protein TonB